VECLYQVDWIALEGSELFNQSPTTNRLAIEKSRYRANLSVSSAIQMHLTSLFFVSLVPFAISLKFLANPSLLSPSAVRVRHSLCTNEKVKGCFMTIALSLFLIAPTPAMADGQTTKFKLPPIDRSDKARCVVKGSAMGQSNAARDSLFDLRECDLRGIKAVDLDLSGVIMTGTQLQNANFRGAQFSKGYLHESDFTGADFTNAVVDRASFKGSTLKQTNFQNAVLTGTSFEGADVEGADFTESYIGDFEQRQLCKNPSLTGTNEKSGMETRVSAGCGA